jgi:hypothetical protein
MSNQIDYFRDNFIFKFSRDSKTPMISRSMPVVWRCLVSRQSASQNLIASSEGSNRPSLSHAGGLQDQCTRLGASACVWPTNKASALEA